MQHFCEVLTVFTFVGDTVVDFVSIKKKNVFRKEKEEVNKF